MSLLIAQWPDSDPSPPPAPLTPSPEEGEAEASGDQGRTQPCCFCFLHSSKKAANASVAWAGFSEQPMVSVNQGGSHAPHQLRKKSTLLLATQEALIPFRLPGLSFQPVQPPSCTTSRSRHALLPLLTASASLWPLHSWHLLIFQVSPLRDPP